jgi:hypothetical protein
MRKLTKEPLPSTVRTMKKRLEHSLNKLEKGEFNPSGKGSKAYHLRNVERCQNFVDKWKHLLDVKLRNNQYTAESKT